MFGTHCDTPLCRARPTVRVVLTIGRNGAEHTSDRERCAECFAVRVASKYGDARTLVLNVYPIKGEVR
jgi:hypothetical protein